MPFFILLGSKKDVLMFPPISRMHAYVVVNLLIGLRFLKQWPSKDVTTSLGVRKRSRKYILLFINISYVYYRTLAGPNFVHPLTAFSRPLIHSSVSVQTIQQVLTEDYADTFIPHATHPLPKSYFSCNWVDRSLLADSFQPQAALCDFRLFCLWAFSKALEAHRVQAFKKW